MFSRFIASIAIFSSALLFAGTAMAGNIAKDTWYQIDSTNFHIITNGDAQAVRTLARDLERYRAVALDLLGARDDGAKLTIYAAADRDSYAGLVGDDLSELTNGLFDTTAEGSYALVNLDGRTGERQLEAREFLFHEYTHFLSYNGTTTHYPYWYSEGFAEFMSTMTFGPDNTYQIGAIPGERAMTLLYTSQMPLQELLRATVYNTPDEEKGRVYASGWMLAHWIIMESGKAKAFKQFVKDYNNGADPVKALSKNLGMSIKEIERHYNAQFESGRFDLARGQVPATFKPANPKVKVMSGQQTVVELARFLVKSGYNAQGLEDLVRYAQREKLYAPELTAVRADAATRAGDYDGAARLLAQVAPTQHKEFWFQNAQAWLWLNREIGSMGSDRSKTMLKEARNKFVNLVNNQSDQAMNWYGLAITMQMLGYPKAQYVEMLEQAYLRAPREVHIAQWMARELYEKKDADYFAEVAQPLLLELTSEAEYNQMKTMLAELKPQVAEQSIKQGKALVKDNKAAAAANTKKKASP
ncbi:hypothetical protein PVT68_09670 [Microbulbifer bruguierae]|uniref:Collagenase n=1 Tax=Microbulbifer bruguierae TaxID=3029061 RepID=A0ABY8NC87_9GAMM|nr:hypothetical protein [Microbulbifer bruguierae]WGL15048.1 hypothetical protein PVT68_09670 [Microbulbifer bruguierae]